jgi:hypothetical protein
MKNNIAVLLFIIIPFLCQAQSRFTLSGFIKDSLNGETLIGASIAVQGKTKGISSNQYGFYSITLEQGDYVLICSFIGYQPKIIAVKLDGNRQLNFDVLPRSTLSQKKRCQC